MCAFWSAEKKNNEIDSLFSFAFIFLFCFVIIFVVRSGCKWRANSNQPPETVICPPPPHTHTHTLNKPCNMEWMYNVMNKITFLILQIYFFTFAAEIRCDKTQFPGTFCLSHNWRKWHLVFLSIGPPLHWWWNNSMLERVKHAVCTHWLTWHVWKTQFVIAERNHMARPSFILIRLLQSIAQEFDTIKQTH